MRWLTFCLTCHLVLLFSAVVFCAEPNDVDAVKAEAETVESAVKAEVEATAAETADPVSPPTVPTTAPTASITAPTTTAEVIASSSAAKPETVLRTASPESLVREAGPPVYYLKDKDGRLVPMLGFGYEDFMELLRKEQSDATETAPAQFTIDETRINGTIEEGRAHLTIDLNVTTRQAGLIRVPIGLSQAIVQEDLKYQGDGSAFLDYDAKKKEYVVWIEGKKDQKHKVLLSVAISTATIGLDTRLRFDAPCSTRSQMNLIIPETGLDIHAPIESRLLTTEGKGAEEKETRLTIDSVRGDFLLLWHKPSVGSSETRAVVEASGEIVVNVGSLDVTCEALLNVQGRGMPLDRFRVRLPKGITNYHVSDGNYQVHEVEATTPEENATVAEENKPVTNDALEVTAEQNQKSRIIEVRLSEPTLEPVLLHLTTTRPLDRLATPDWIEPVGFEVIDAVRQWGYIATVVGPDHFVSWLPERGIRRVDALPSTMSVKKPSAVFEYYSVPFLLKSRIAPRRTRVSVEPEHIVQVGADQLQIDSTLRYTIRGKSVLSLELNLGSWELDDIGPETLVDVDGIEISPTGLVTVPLLRPTIGHTRITVKAHRAAPQQDSKLEIVFPRPRVDSPGPAVVVILPDDNVKLLPDATASAGLSRLQAAPSIRLPERQQLPLYYRGDTDQSTFTAERSIHKRQVSVDIRSMVAFEMLTANVEQSFTYQIDHEPSDQIVLDVPESLVKATSLEFLVDGIPVVPRVLNESLIKQPEVPAKATDTPAAPAVPAVPTEVPSTPDAKSTKGDTMMTSTMSDETPLDKEAEVAVEVEETVPVSSEAGEETEAVTVPPQPVVSEVSQPALPTAPTAETAPQTLETAPQAPSIAPIVSEPATKPESSDANGEAVSKTVPVVLTLKPARIGRCVVTVRYSLSRRVLMPNTPIKRSIPLVLPSAERILRHELSVVSPLGLTVEVLENQTETGVSGTTTPANEVVKPTTSGTTAGGPVVSNVKPILEPIIDAMISKSDLATGTRQNFNVTDRLESILVLVSIEKRHEAPATTIQRAFFQTYVKELEYQNRAIFRFQTRQKQLPLTLPTTTIDRSVQLYLNDQLLTLEPLGEHRFLVTFPTSLVGSQQLELRWTSRPATESRTDLALGMPQLGEDTWIQRWYWQLLLPTGTHLLGTPREVLSESVWSWNGGFFKRDPLMKTDALERWVGAEAITTNAPSANLYLFSSFGQPQEIHFRVANRSLIVLSASGLVLICGFLLIYVPATRHPASLLVLGVILGSVGVMYPEPMLLSLQASSIGVILVGVTAILKRRMVRPQLPRPIPIAESGGSSILDRDSTQRQVVLPSVVGHQGTTETRLKPPGNGVE